MGNIQLNCFPNEDQAPDGSGEQGKEKEEVLGTPGGSEPLNEPVKKEKLTASSPELINAVLRLQSSDWIALLTALRETEKERDFSDCNLEKFESVMKQLSIVLNQAVKDLFTVMDHAEQGTVDADQMNILVTVMQRYLDPPLTKLDREKVDKVWIEVRDDVDLSEKPSDSFVKNAIKKDDFDGSNELEKSECKRLCESFLLRAKKHGGYNGDIVDWEMVFKFLDQNGDEILDFEDVRYTMTAMWLMTKDRVPLARLTEIAIPDQSSGSPKPEMA